MPGRKIPLITDNFYHVLNRGVASQPTFKTKRDFSRAIETLRYYQNENFPLRYAQFIVISQKKRMEIREELTEAKEFLAEIIAFCFMPNHFHLILKQKIDNGISKFMSNFTNSYTRYFNFKNKRIGPLFQGKFKAVRIETAAQLLHVSRYIHLNPYSSYVVKSFKELKNYPYSSFPEYLGKSQIEICSKEIIFDDVDDILSYKKFIFDQADYQRRLEEIKHLLLEE